MLRFYVLEAPERQKITQWTNITTWSQQANGGLAALPPAPALNHYAGLPRFEFPTPFIASCA